MLSGKQISYFNCEHGGYRCCFFVFGEKIDVPGSV